MKPIVILLYLMLILVSSQDDLKKKSISELKQFLLERGVACLGCSEKSDFIKMVEANANTPVIPAAMNKAANIKGAKDAQTSERSKSKSKSASSRAKEGSFAESWAQTTENLCSELVREEFAFMDSSSSDSRCAQAAAHIRSSFSKMSTSLSNVFKGGADPAITSQKTPFKEAGLKMMKRFFLEI